MKNSDKNDVSADSVKNLKMDKKALSHIKVIDLTQSIAGPYCTKLMAGFGAQVIKIEPPEKGDRMRSVGPFLKNKEGVEASIPFLWLNTGKKSLTLDLKNGRDKEAFKKLVSTADVVVENFSPGVMSGLGLDYHILKEINPGLVMASISNFGQTGPYRDYKAEEIQEYAMSGSMYMTGDPDKPPLCSGPAICQYTAGVHAYSAILLALFHREHIKRGQYIDISIMESGIENIETKLTSYLHLGKKSKRGAHVFSPWGLYSCRDGYAAIIGAPFRHWKNGSVIFQEPRLLEDKYKYVKYRAEHRNEIDSMITPWIKANGKKEVVRIGRDHNFAFAYLATFEEVFESAQHKARGFFEEVDHPVAGKHKYCGAPFKMSRTPWETRRAPLLGEHNKPVNEEASEKAKSEISLPNNAKDNFNEGLPLQGIRVLDLTHSWAGPHCTRVLADFGAEVIRVEYPRRMCMFRGGIKDNRAYNNQPAWFHLNRNKLSITLDLKVERDKKILKNLIKEADVFIENSRSGVIEQLGFGYKDVAGINPNIIMISMAAFGNTGPDAKFGAYGAAIEVSSGIQNLTAYGANDKPQRIKELDVTNGVGALSAVMTALVHRQKNGSGQHIDFAQMEFSSHALIGEHLLEYAMNKTHVPAMGNRHRKFAPQGCYKCKGDDKWVTLTVRNEEEWKNLCLLMGDSRLQTDLRFISPVLRMKNHDELDELISRWTAEHSHYEVMRILQGRGIPSGAVLDTEDLSTDLHLKERGYFIGETGGSGKQYIGMPFKLSEGGGTIRWRGPDLGQHNEYVLCEILGRSKDEIKPINTEEIGTAFDS